MTIQYQNHLNTIAQMAATLTEQYYAQLIALNKEIANRTEAPYPTKAETAIMARLLAAIKQLSKTCATPEPEQVLTDFVNEAAPQLAEPGTNLHSVLQHYINKKRHLYTAHPIVPTTAALTEPGQEPMPDPAAWPHPFIN